MPSREQVQRSPHSGSARQTRPAVSSKAASVLKDRLEISTNQTSCPFSWPLRGTYAALASAAKVIELHGELARVLSEMAE
jgi:hypothetical protein